MKLIRLISFCLSFSIVVLHLQAQPVSQGPGGQAERAYYLQSMLRIADPVLQALSKNELRKRMPVEINSTRDRSSSSHLEAFGRLLDGMAPWLELGPDPSAEGRLRKKYIDLAVKCIQNATNPSSADFMNFNEGRQPLVDAAFLAQALLRAPKQLWGNLDENTRGNVLKALKSSRVITPSYTNWLLFSATVETAIEKFSGEGDQMRIEYAVRQFQLWYKGDGIYGDGPNFHWDYYNSFVIQPMLLDVVHELVKKDDYFSDIEQLTIKRAQRYAAIQERLISPIGTYPPIGRSLTYRFGAFHLLSDIAWMRKLPNKVSPQQVRYALYTVIKNQIEAKGTFDKNGWLQIGVYGHQPELGETYISTGSLYLCAEVFLVLGLPPSDPFWTEKDEYWTSRKIWSGEHANIDHADD